MTREEWEYGKDRIWRLMEKLPDCPQYARVLATLEPDPDSGQYRDGNGHLLGRKWEDARARVEDAVRKGSR